MNLSTKLALWFAGTTALAVGALDFWTQHVYRRTLQEMVLASAERNTDLIRRSTRHAMMKNAREDLYFTLNSIGGLPGMGRVRIFNKEGRITYSTDSRELEQMVDKSAEACYGCHSSNGSNTGPMSPPKSSLPRSDRVRFFRQGDIRVLGLISPIENEPECANAACHAHPAAQRVLGVFDVQIPMDKVDAQLADFERTTLILDLLSIALISALAFLLAFRLVRRPVSKLMVGIRQVASGQLDHHIPVTSSDELGLLASAFNDMNGQLADARRESENWAATLEQRVAEKTADLERAHKQLVESEKIASLGKLSASVAHEINNPLAGILTYARLLSRTLERAKIEHPELPEWRRWLEVIEGESRRCGAIVKNLLTFARQLPVEKKENDLNQIVERCLMLIHHQADLQSVALEWTPNPEVARVVCDAGQTQQALLAILINAVEAMPHGGNISIAAQAVTDGTRIIIADDGPGIPPDVQSHIFEPFFTTKNQGKGTGLGLSIAFGILQQHGGRIEVESSPGRGTEFRVFIPYSAPASPRDPVAPEVFHAV